MKKVLLTGASSGIGAAITHLLLDEGEYEVFGIGRTFREEPDDPHFHPIVLDLMDEHTLEKKIHEIRADRPFDILINNAGTAFYGLHEEMNPSKIHAMVRTNLEVPLVLTQLLLRDLKKVHGTIINISSVTALGPAPHGAAYGATKSALLNFSRSLFEEARKSGVKVTAILPDMTQTDLYRSADFQASEESGCSLAPEDVAYAVLFTLSEPAGVAIPELHIRPQYHRIQRKKPAP